jgi:hypothetical protein
MRILCVLCASVVKAFTTEAQRTRSYLSNKLSSADVPYIAGTGMFNSRR